MNRPVLSGLASGVASAPREDQAPLARGADATPRAEETPGAAATALPASDSTCGFVDECAARFRTTLILLITGKTCPIIVSNASTPTACGFAAITASRPR